MNKKAKKALNIVLDVVLAVFFVLCMVALVLAVSSKKSSDGAVSFLGRQIRIVVSPSMEKSDAVDVSQYKIKSIPVKSVVFIRLVPEDEAKANDWYSQLEVGDVLTFKYVYSTDYVITHRIVEIAPNQNGGYTIVLQGDNRESDQGAGKQTIDTSKTGSLNYVIGKVTGTSYVLGVLITALKQPIGLSLMVIVPCAIIIVIEVMKVVEVLRADKTQKAAEAAQQQSDQIEELKRQIAALQQAAAPAPSNEDAQQPASPEAPADAMPAAPVDESESK